jgi:predicted dehydrogenase
VPERLRLVPEAVPFGPPHNVGQAYVRLAKAIHAGEQFAPDFDDALRLHQLLDAVQRSSDEGRTITLG